MTEIYLHFLFAHYGLYGNAPVHIAEDGLQTIECCMNMGPPSRALLSREADWHVTRCCHIRLPPSRADNLASRQHVLLERPRQLRMRRDRRRRITIRRAQDGYGLFPYNT